MYFVNVLKDIFAFIFALIILTVKGTVRSSFAFAAVNDVYENHTKYTIIPLFFQSYYVEKKNE